MKFIVSSTNLLKHLNYVAGVITTNPALPILENFLFIVEKKKLIIIGTDIDTVIKTNLEIENNEEGKICVPSKIILEYLKSISEQPITIQIDGEKKSVQILTSNGNYQFLGEDAQHFPKDPIEDKAQSFELPSFYLLDAINNTLFSVSNDDTRVNMSGVYFNLKDNSIVFVATDGHRLVKHVTENVSLPAQKESFIVPKKPLSILKNLLPDDDSKLNISYSKKHLFVKSSEGLTLVCTLLNATFPDYNSVIPQQNTSELIIDKKELQTSLKRVGLFSSRANNLVRFLIRGGSLTLSAKDDDYSVNADEKLTCQYTGEDLTIGFNSKSLTELLNPIKTNDVKITFSLPSRPALILPTQNQDNVVLEMIQIPLMLSDEVDA